MLPLSPFSLSEPKNLHELSVEVSNIDSTTKLIAGGTDLLPNLKHGLYHVRHLISLRRLSELKFIDIDENRLSLGALTKLSDIATNKMIHSHMPALAQTSARIASPQIRNMGTVGGNICLDTRCLYFNQTEFWRRSLGYCLKKDGCACHVVKTGKRCVAAASNDLATILLAYSAKVSILGRDQSYVVPLDEFYTAHGEKNNMLPLGHLVTDVRVDFARASFAGFYKVRMRESIDFPLLSVAVLVRVEDGLLISGRLVLNALVAKPKVFDLDEFANLGYNRELINAIADFAQRKCHPQTNIIGDVSFRKHMIAVAVKRAFYDALETV